MKVRRNNQLFTLFVSNGNLEELLGFLELLRPIKPRPEAVKSMVTTAYTGDIEMAKRFLAASNNPKELLRMGDLLPFAIRHGLMKMLVLKE